LIKRIVTFLLALSLLAGFCMASGSEPPVVSTRGISVKPGGSAELTVNISGNTGLSAFCITVRCDTEIFSVDYDEESGSYAVQTGENFKKGQMLCNKDGTKSWKIFWFNMDGTAIKSDGEMFTLPINAKAGTPKGEYPVTIGYEAKNTLDGDLNKTALQCKASVINVLPTTAVFELRELEAVPGGQAMIEVCITENPGIASFEVQIGFEKGLFTATKAEDGGYTVFEGESNIKGSFIANDYTTKGYRILWYSPVETIKTGSVLKFPVTVAETAEGEYDITLTVKENSVSDERGNTVQAVAKGGKAKMVSVVSSEPETTVTANAVSVALSVSTNDEAVLATAAIYSEDSKMLGIKTETVPANSSEEIEFIFASKIDQACYVKIFFLKESGWEAFAHHEHIDLAGTEEVK